MNSILGKFGRFSSFLPAALKRILLLPGLIMTIAATNVGGERRLPVRPSRAISPPSIRPVRRARGLGTAQAGNPHDLGAIARQHAPPRHAASNHRSPRGPLRLHPRTPHVRQRRGRHGFRLPALARRTRRTPAGRLVSSLPWRTLHPGQGGTVSPGLPGLWRQPHAHRRGTRAAGIRRAGGRCLRVWRAGAPGARRRPRRRRRRRGPRCSKPSSGRAARSGA